MMDLMMINITFEQIAITTSGILYFIVGMTYLIKKEYAWAIIWFAYSTANIGLMLAQKKC